MTNPARPPHTPNGAAPVGGAPGALGQGLPSAGLPQPGHASSTDDASGFVPRAAPNFQSNGLPVGAGAAPANLPFSAPPTGGAPEARIGLGQPQAPPGPDLNLGKTLDGRYLIEKVLGEGGMGVVYLARHTIIGKRIAVKILRPEYTRDQEILDRFVLEAQTASSIGNPHIVDISDFGRTPDGGTYFVMEFLEGESLSDAMTTTVNGEARGLPLALDRIYDVTQQICNALGAAHDRGIVHRDLKPDNIFLVKRDKPDFVKILDFGIAKVTSDNPAQKLTRAGAVFGTPQYMSPEQAAGGTVDRRADVYALGIILYEMISGQLPFDGDNFMGILTQHMYKAPVPVRALINTAACPPGLEAVIQKCLHKRADLRYQTMAELADDIRLVAAKMPPKAIRELMSPGQQSQPHDYFKSAQFAVVPAAPRGERAGWPYWVWIVVVLSTALVMAGVLLVRRVLLTRTPPVSVVTAQPVDSVAPAPDSPSSDKPAAPAASSAATPPVMAYPKVVLKVTPPSATLKRAGRLLVVRTIDLKPGEKVTLEASARGFVTRTVVVDGTESPLEIALDAEAAPGLPAGAKGNAGKTKNRNTDGTGDPW